MQQYSVLESSNTILRTIKPDAIASGPVQSGPVQSSAVQSSAVQSDSIQSGAAEDVRTMPTQAVPAQTLPVWDATGQKAAVRFSAPAFDTDTQNFNSTFGSSAEFALLSSVLPSAPDSHAVGIVAATVPISGFSASLTPAQPAQAKPLWETDQQAANSAPTPTQPATGKAAAQFSLAAEASAREAGSGFALAGGRQVTGPSLTDTAQSGTGNGDLLVDSAGPARIQKLISSLNFELVSFETSTPALITLATANQPLPVGAYVANELQSIVNNSPEPSNADALNVQRNTVTPRGLTTTTQSPSPIGLAVALPAASFSAAPVGSGEAAASASFSDTLPDTNNGEALDGQQNTVSTTEPAPTAQPDLPIGLAVAVPAISAGVAPSGNPKVLTSTLPTNDVATTRPAAQITTKSNDPGSVRQTDVVPAKAANGSAVDSETPAMRDNLGSVLRITSSGTVDRRVSTPSLSANQQQTGPDVTQTVNSPMESPVLSQAEPSAQIWPQLWNAPFSSVPVSTNQPLPSAINSVPAKGSAAAASPESARVAPAAPGALQTKGAASASSDTDSGSGPGRSNSQAGSPVLTEAAGAAQPKVLETGFADLFTGSPAVPHAPQAPAATTSGQSVRSAEPQQLAGGRLPAENGETTPVAASGVNTARLMQAISGSEMQVGMRSAEFGNISIRTSVVQQQMVAQIAVDHGDLSKAIASQVSLSQTRLSDEHGLQARIEVQMHGASTAADSGSSAHRDARSFTTSPRALRINAAEEIDNANLRAALPTENEHRLDIRA
jgi:hypothetical protein